MAAFLYPYTINNSGCFSYSWLLHFLIPRINFYSESYAPREKAEFILHVSPQLPETGNPSTVIQILICQTILEACYSLNMRCSPSKETRTLRWKNLVERSASVELGPCKLLYPHSFRLTMCHKMTSLLYHTALQPWYSYPNAFGKIPWTESSETMYQDKSFV